MLPSPPVGSRWIDNDPSHGRKWSLQVACSLMLAFGPSLLLPLEPFDRVGNCLFGEPIRLLLERFPKCRENGQIPDLSQKGGGVPPHRAILICQRAHGRLTQPLLVLWPNGPRTRRPRCDQPRIQMVKHHGAGFL